MAPGLIPSYHDDFLAAASSPSFQVASLVEDESDSDDDDDGHDSDSEFGGDDDEKKEMVGTFPPPDGNLPPPPPPLVFSSLSGITTSTLASATASVPTSVQTTSTATSSTLSTSMTGSGVKTSTLGSSSSTARQVSAPAQSTPSRFNDPNSIPQNEADPQFESKAAESPLGTAGIVLASVFGFIALVTTCYFLWRMSRRRKQKRWQESGLRPLSWEKQDPNAFATAQDTNAIFGSRFQTPTLAQPRGRGRFSFLNRRWYSTGSQMTRSQAQSEAPSTPPRWGAPFFGLGLTRSPASPDHGSWFRSPRPWAHQTPHHGPIDLVTSDISRSASQRSAAGEGNARAYAFHNVSPPARTTISSLSSLRLKRRSDISRVSLHASPTNDRPVSSISVPVDTLRDDSHQNRESGKGMPRLPLRAASPT